ncbi:hypothetical protein HETIRDRAFT_328421, partial [Heterobasidion irregulare TC 32-1]
RKTAQKSPLQPSGNLYLPALPQQQKAREANTKWQTILRQVRTTNLTNKPCSQTI